MTGEITFVSEGEPPELWVVHKPLYADETWSFNQSHDSLALLRELWWLLRLPPGGLVEVVQQRREGDLLCQSVDMHDRRVTRTDNVLVIQDRELGFKLANGMDWFVRTRQDEPRCDILVIYPSNPDPDIVARKSNVNLLFHLVVDRGHFDRIPVRH